jgi:hypothetical protein
MIEMLLASLALVQDSPSKEQGKLHPFIAKALASPHALKTNFFVTEEGRVIRSSVHVKKGGLPDWVHAMADEKIGAGDDMEYELEVYPDGSEVYEIYRKIDGKERQLSVRPDRTIYYIGAEIEPEALPKAVSATLEKLQHFEMASCVSKEGATFHEYHVKGTLDGQPVRARIAKDGRLIAVQKRLPSEVEVEVNPLKGAQPVF